MRPVKAFLLPVMALVCIATLLGCSSPKGIAVNKQQTVVMDSSVLTAGILASQPAISTSSGNNVARSVITNSQSKPIKINYRFYWYDAQGLMCCHWKRHDLSLLRQMMMWIFNQLIIILMRVVRVFIYSYNHVFL